MASFKCAVAAFTFEETRFFGPYDPFETNLSPALTGLSMAIWVSRRRFFRDVVDISRSTTVTVGPAPRLIAGDLSMADIEAVSAWIRLNEPPRAAYWNYQIDTAQLIQRLRPYATH